MISIICALADNRAIGFENRLLFHLRADLQRFKSLTTGHTIIMGRKTFESFPKGALPNRRNVVLSRNAQFQAENAEVFPSLEEALKACRDDDKIFIIGGASVYAEALPLADELLLTHVHAIPENADAFFPEFSPSEWRLVQTENHSADEQNEADFSFSDYERK